MEGDLKAPVEYPPFVVTEQQKDRWDKAQVAAEAVVEQTGGNAETVWLATRSLYNSDIPTDDPSGE